MDSEITMRSDEERNQDAALVSVFHMVIGVSCFVAHSAMDETVTSVCFFQIPFLVSYTRSSGEFV